MLTGMLHTHKLVVTLFLLIYLIKTILLLLNKKEALETFTKKIKLTEIIVSVLFLITGIVLAINSPDIGSWFWCKIAAVILSIPLAVVAFKKKKPGAAILSLVLLVYAYGVSETRSPVFKKEKTTIAVSANKSEEGKEIYTKLCVSCHGDNGKLMLGGAKDLTISTLSKEELITQVKQGKNMMPSFAGQLSEEQMSAVVDYISTLKK